MRTARIVMMMGLLSVSLGMTGCKNSLKEKNALLTQENQSLHDQLSQRNAALSSAEQERRGLEAQLAQMRRDGETGGAMGGQTGFEDIAGVTGSAGAGEVTASVESDLLFDSGKTSIKTSAKRSLDQVVQVLNSTYGEKRIRIAGHTDTDPIKKSGHKSNYHLGFERAYAVRDYLISKGVSPGRIYLASFGPDVPKSSKPQSRRVEIVVVMNEGAMMTSAN